MSIVKQLDKRSGITYVYESTSYWDREKKQPRSKRKLIGKLDPETGEVVPTDGRGKRRRQANPDNPAKRGPVPAIHTERLFYGATYLFDQIGVETGVAADLKTCFPRSRSCLSRITGSSKIRIRSSGSGSGLSSTGTLTGKTSPPRGARRSSSPSPKKRRCGSSAFRESGA